MCQTIHVFLPWLSSVGRERFSVGWDVNVSGPRRLFMDEREEDVEGGFIPEVNEGILLAISLFRCKSQRQSVKS